MKYDGVIFDKDGVLLDSMSDGFKWAEEIRKKFYRAYSVEHRIASRVMFSQKMAALQHLLENGVSIAEVKTVETKVSKYKIKRIKNGEITLFPEVESVLQQIDLPKAVVSNATLEATEFTVNHFNLNQYFQQVEAPSLDDPKHYLKIKKPNTYMISKVMRNTGMENPLMVGDTSDDILAARNAGIDVCLCNAWKDYSELNPEYEIDRIGQLPEILN
jgi:HAD superfamily hydrolase (TIGR01549 family)